MCLEVIVQKGQNAVWVDATLGYYESNACAFCDDTAGAAMSATLTEFVSLLPVGASVLDWGCGTGRDSRALLDGGFVVTSTDASPAMCRAAKELFGVDAICEGFEDLDEAACYDGIWACASLLHVCKDNLRRTFEIACNALKSDGVFYASFKLGDFEGMRNGRWFTDLDEESLELLLQPVFTVARMWVTGDVRPGRGDEKWLNCLARKRL